MSGPVDLPLQVCHSLFEISNVGVNAPPQRIKLGGHVCHGSGGLSEAAKRGDRSALIDPVSTFIPLTPPAEHTGGPDGISVQPLVSHKHHTGSACYTGSCVYTSMSWSVYSISISAYLMHSVQLAGCQYIVPGGREGRVWLTSSRVFGLS